MTNGHEAMEQIVDTIKAGVEQMAETFEAPSDDWLPTLFMVDADGHLSIAAIDTGFLSSPDHKELLTEQVLPAMIAKQDSIAAAFISSAWARTYDRESAQMIGEREEVVMVSAATAFELKTLSVPIVRHSDSPPTLGEWTEWPVNVEGTFPEALRAGLSRQG